MNIETHQTSSEDSQIRRMEPLLTWACQAEKTREVLIVVVVEALDDDDDDEDGT